MSHFGLNLGQTAEDSEMFTNIWLSSKAEKEELKMSVSVRMPRCSFHADSDRDEPPSMLNATFASLQAVMGVNSFWN